MDIDGAEPGDTCSVDASWHDGRPVGRAVAFYPPGSKSPAVARVVAREGDVVEVKRKRFWVNGRQVPKNRRNTPAYTIPRITVPRDCAYLLVDGADGIDSVEHGPIPCWRILGEVKP
jgi:hypothetical protein